MTEYWAKAKRHLTKHDPVLAPIIKRYSGEMLVSRGDPFFTLARSIVGQQISVKAADSVWAKFQAAVVDVTPGRVLITSPDVLRACGLSGQKVGYMLGLAQHFEAHTQRMHHLADMDDEAVIRELTSIKGIGRWTAEMYLMFHLGRPDVLPLADIGLQKAVFIHYFEGQKIPLKQITALAEAWRPYRSVATWYLWRALDPVPVAY
jgi:DNA-3-methyladenine glycosylase II